MIYHKIVSHSYIYIYIYIYIYVIKTITPSYFLNTSCGAGKFVVPAHFTLGSKTQAEETYCRGCIMRAPKGPKDVAEDDLTLSIP